jgi:hypothetical protein
MAKHKANKEGTQRGQAEYWLEKAAAHEESGKGERFVEMAFTAALKHEDAAIAAGE